MVLCEEQTYYYLEHFGLMVPRRPEAMRVTTPAQFEWGHSRTGGGVHR